MQVTIYSRDNCSNCLKAKKKLSKFNPKIIMLDKDINREEFLNKFPNSKTVPQIIINNSHIGGYEDLEKWLAFNIPDENF